MPRAQVSIFVSYSRRDSSFVDKLEADLKMRNFSTWVDREETEGTPAWKHILRDVIDQSNIILIVLSPASILSHYVQMEYTYAFRKDKLSISLEYQHCQELPADLKDIQPINFTSSYQQGLKDLLSTLGYVDSDPSLKKPDQVDRFNQAREAQKAGQWRKAVGFWQVLHDLEPKDTEVLLGLEQCWCEQGKLASARGQWEEAISAWEVLLKLKSGDVQALRQLSLAQHNHSYKQYYMDAQQFIEENELVPARMQLQWLWRYAPYYGDPAGLAQKSGITKPLRNPKTVEEEEKQRIESEQKKREEQIRKEQEARRRQREGEKPAKLSTNGEVAGERESVGAKEKQVPALIQIPVQRTAAGWLGENEIRKTQQPQRVERKLPNPFINHAPVTPSLTAWWSFLCLLSGSGLIVNILLIRPTQLWPSAAIWTMMTVVLGAFLVYLAGYHKAMGFFSAIIMTMLSGLLAFMLTRLIFPALHDFDREQKSQVFFKLISHSFWIGRQINAGLIIGGITAFSLFFLMHSVSNARNKISKASFSGLFAGAALVLLFWSILAILAWIFNWGWGFGPGWYWSLFGVATGAATATGLGASLVIWVKERPVTW